MTDPSTGSGLEVREAPASYRVMLDTLRVRPGYKQTEVGVIPDDWVVAELGNIGECLIGLTYKPSNVKAHGTLVLRSSNIQDGVLAFDDNVYVDAEIPDRIRVMDGDILVCVRNGSRALIGKCALLDERVVGQTFGAFMSVYRTAYSAFIFQQFQSEIIKRQISENIGATINQITNGNLNAFRVPLPPNAKEREAIAIALSDVDALLASLDKLIAKKRDLKQGAMQQLLTGQRRLPGFSGEWEIKRLGDVVEIRKGQLITEKDAILGAVPVIAGGKKPAYFHNKPNRTGKTITVSASGASAGYVAFFDTPIFASDCSTISEGWGYSIEFIYFQLQLKQEVIYQAQTGGAQPHIHSVDLMPLEIGCPSLEEQNAIATILSDMDAEIAALEARRDKTRALKQGMMQELLTGRIRLV